MRSTEPSPVRAGDRGRSLRMGATIVWILFGLGALLCVTNFYFSFLRYALRRLRGLPKESYHSVSGFPLFGSLFVALSLLGLHDIPAMIPVATVLMLTFSFHRARQFAENRLARLLSSSLGGMVTTRAGGKPGQVVRDRGG